MHPRQSIIEIFSTFLQFEGDRFHNWATDARLRRSSIIPLPILPQVQAQNLISRLANPDIVRPRLHIPFQLWGALIEHGGWRQSLYQQRLGLPGQWSILQWLESGVSQVAQNMGWESLNMQVIGAGSRSVEESQPAVMLSRRLAIAGKFYQIVGLQ